YGFSYDLMGNNWTSDGYDAVNWLALAHQIDLGWFAGRFVDVSPPSGLQSQTYAIAPIEQRTPSSTQGLVITTATRRYFVEFRQPLGQDAFRSHWADATSGVLISMRDYVSCGAPEYGNLDTAP